MPPLRPHGVSAPDTLPDDARLGRWLAGADTLHADTRVAVIGFPVDDGVRRNGGRPGAAQGPEAIRRALYAMTPDARSGDAYSALLDRTVDLGDIVPSGDLASDQRALGDAVASVLDVGAVPIVLGDGHETAYGHALGYLDHGRSVDLLNWDAHTDVRPLRDGHGHSGSPFRQALAHPSGLARTYTVAGAMPWRVAAAHASVPTAIVWRDELDADRIDDITAGLSRPTYASFDLDLVAAGAAPGVSAPGVGGLSVELWLRAAEACGRASAVTSLDIVELCPAHDADGRAATLAALTVWHMLRGVAAR